MKLTIIGNNGVFPAAGGACSSYLVQTDGANILMDMGPGSLSKLQQKISIDEIDIFVFTHLHFDHVSDFFSLKYALQLKKARGEYRKRPVLILPKTPESIFELMKDDDLFETRILCDEQSIQYGNTLLTFAKMTHPVESYAVRVTERDSVVVYSGDTNSPKRIREFAKDADVLLSDAGLTERHKNPSAPHMSIAEACRAGELAKKTLLVHLNPVYTKEEIIEEMIGNAEISEIGWEWQN